MARPATALRFGLEVFLERPAKRLGKKRLALVCHPASIDRHLVHAADLVHDKLGSRLVALFGPQHGARGEKQDNMIESDHYRDPRLKLPVHSLYSSVREPTEQMLSGIDVLLIDLQDVGTRVYTFVTTMIACMRAAARSGRSVVVLDRPNPIGGDQVEGHLLEPGFHSFVGQLGIPMRHGMTIGELALWANAELALGCELDVITMRGWRRSYYWDDLERHWIAPSPNMPTLDTAICYPGGVLFEGTNVSEGRGTTQPFQVIGAPFIDPHELIEATRTAALRGVHLRATFFEPTFHKWHGQLCGGVQVHVLDRNAFEPYHAYVALLQAMRKLWPRKFAWKEPPYEYEFDRMPIDLIAGTAALREMTDVAAAMKSLSTAIARFKKGRSEYLLYD